MPIDPPADDAPADPSLTRRRLLAATAAGAGAFSLAGCSDVTNRHYAAVPMILPEGVRETFGYEVVRPDRLLEERAAEAGRLDVDVVVESYAFVYRRDEEAELAAGWAERAAPPVGVLATPRVEEAGRTLNPIAAEPLGELIGGTWGRDLLARVGLVEDGETADPWLIAPEQVDRTEAPEAAAFEAGDEGGAGTTIQRHAGVLEGTDDGPARAVLVDAVRGDREDDAVVVVSGVQRELTPAEEDGVLGGDCESIQCLQEDLGFGAWGTVVDELASAIELCPAFDGVDPGNRGSVDLDDCVSPSGGGDSIDMYGLDVANPRLVQRVEDTVVTPPGGSTSYTEPDPPLVDGDPTAVVFDLEESRSSDAGIAAWDTSVQVDVDRRLADGTLESDRFLIPNGEAKDVLDGDHPIAVLHALADDGTAASDPVIFPGDVDLESVTISIDAEDDHALDWSVIGDDVTLRAGPNEDFEVRDLPPLRVGFVAVEDVDDGARFGDANGGLRDFARSWRSATEYLQRAYPGKVVSYRHDEDVVEAVKYGLFCNDTCEIKRHMLTANNLLQRVATDPSYPPNGSSFPNGGELDLDGLDRSRLVTELESNGFDVTVAIVPGSAPNNGGVDDYYDFYGVNAIGLAYADPGAAVSSIGVNPTGNDEGISTTVAQEIGHYFQDDYAGPTGHPMAQRDTDSVDDRVNNVPVDTDHARHQNSSNVGGGDPPGVLSTAFDLVDGFANVQSYTNSGGSWSVDGPDEDATSIGKGPSYMSYTGRDDEAWADARIEAQLIDSGWGVAGTSGAGGAGAMVAVGAAVDDEGTIHLEEVRAFTGIERYTDLDDAPVTAELLGPDGEVLERARVPAEIATTHDHREGVLAPTFSLPFDDRGVRVRTTYARGDSVATMNPVVRAVRDAVGRVPDAGFSGEPGIDRREIGAALDAVAAAMDRGAYGEAAAAMDGPVREEIVARVRGHEGGLNRPSPEALAMLVDDMVRRLELLAETAG